jgi:hypothetical protein
VRDAGAWVRKSGAADRVPRAVAFLVLFWDGGGKDAVGCFERVCETVADRLDRGN